MVTVGIFILCESFWVRAVKIPIITNTSWVISNSDNMSRVHFASELQHYYCILEIKLIFGENNPRIFASNRIWNTFTKANISTKNTSAKVFFDFEITLSSLVFSKQFCYLCQKRAAKISGKVTEKIRRIWVQNFSVENCISECRVSLKKCLLCASGAETDHPAGITNSRSRDFCSFFCVKMLADVGTLNFRRLIHSVAKVTDQQYVWLFFQKNILWIVLFLLYLHLLG